MKVILPDHIYEQISGITFLALTSKKVCNALKFSISLNGRLDREQLREKNPCLSKLRDKNLIFKDPAAISS